ncbi:hypothetical protein BDV41DRAFT_588917 [Aspergillus transmontanensis]|uniref:T6SS Phospholipase effector Tle1-like catalytic domain-containing protein n=1 Tax=Aspergillus transmontanensis TaxID=1034304 RepID=A0A5N6VVM4_9EURO|nr:hypothetical protein BDV41DRAFT_588917 [Aspergillus transmontanensis]
MSDLPWSERKRLIVCCDGTWQDSTGDSFKPPTNVTRISRAISRDAVTIENDVKKRISQIVYYQKGVGTGNLLGDKLGGGALGLGLSANVRAAYAFLADNYDDGDEIFFFGYSRGAYTARAVAGLVTRFGLLTPRGMDNFTTLYNEFYGRHHKPASELEDKYKDKKRREKVGFREPLPPYTIKIIGVWDTVAFHNNFASRLFGEKLELPNTVLSPDVEYAFQALALDEDRNAYQPVIWHLPKNHGRQELLQVWFSGHHSDIGGGTEEPRLSDIALAWMVAQCTKNMQLGIDLEYFYDHQSTGIQPWATHLVDVNPTKSIFARFFEKFLGHSPRTPLGYPPDEGNLDITNEYIHQSIEERDFKSWPSAVVKGRGTRPYWALADGKEIKQIDAIQVEHDLKGRIRKVNPNEWDDARNTP